MLSGDYQLYYDTNFDSIILSNDYEYVVASSEEIKHLDGEGFDYVKLISKSMDVTKVVWASGKVEVINNQHIVSWIYFAKK